MFLDEIILAQKKGVSRGIPSVCSAHPWVLTTVMEHAVQTGQPVLVESTCNQVNQFGGYTGFTPEEFIRHIRRNAVCKGLVAEQIILGGDHLGPSPWQNEPADAAMQKAEDLVRCYVQAGYSKIHLDTSMKLGGDNQGTPLDPFVAAQRTARLAKISEETLRSNSSLPEPRYVIGTEVPIPGGAREHEDRVTVTLSKDVKETIDVTRKAFVSMGLEDAWDRVTAVVVQPGVEFGDDFVIDYQPRAAKPLSQFIEHEDRLVFEAHSTDYQTRQSLRHLVRDHFAILKVGPALTYAFRKGIFALTDIENEILTGDKTNQRSNVIQVLDETMQQDKRYWENYYQGSAEHTSIARKYSLSDRIRYYWTAKPVQEAIKILFNNFKQVPLPLPLLDQYAPVQYERIRAGKLNNSAGAIISDFVLSVLRDYDYACNQTG
jgi:D-tagatose-1,6-bisphosphate aldolase subunit GatZ/KbaZ